jgi:pyrroloquinoline quinone biosynthesis protein D
MSAVSGNEGTQAMSSITGVESSAQPAASEVPLGAKPAIGRGFRLQWEPAQNAHVLLYPEGMVKLNGSAGEIMKRCDGVRPVSAIIEDLQQAFNAPDLTKDVTAFMSFAVAHKWLELRE